MAGRKSEPDREIDLHGFTATEARGRLNTLWSTREWQGLQRVRVIHGTGDVLHALVKVWCEEKGVAWTVEPHNPGVTIIHPGQRLQAPPPPPHRPLHPLKHHRPAAKQRDRSLPDPDTGLTDAQLMAREFERLGVTPAADLLRGKRSTNPGPPPAETAPGPEKPPPFQHAPPLPTQLTNTDPMQEEFERLKEDNPLTLFKRKRDLLPPREAPKSANHQTVTPHLPSPPVKPRDLMAEEFARLADEPPRTTRGRKRE